MQRFLVHGAPSTSRFLALTLLAAVSVAACAYASQGGLASQFHALIVLALAQFALMAWVALDKSFDTLDTAQVLVTAIVLGVIALWAQPLLEDDHFRYLWDGYITATSGRPYAHPPAHYFAHDGVPPVMLDVLNGINHPELTTIYGPLLQGLFALCYWAAPSELWPFKLLLLGAEAAALRGLRAAGMPNRTLLLLTLHPLLIKESAITAHPDLLLGVALLGAVLAWRDGRQGWAACLAAAAVAMKFSALAVAPLFCVTREGRWSPRGTLAMALTLACFYLPTLTTLSGSELQALTAFGQKWLFNPLLFKAAAAMLDDGAARILVLAAFALAWIALCGRWLYHLRLAHHTPHTRGRGAPFVPSSPLPPVATVLTVLLLLSPVVNPWYWLWILPLATVQASRVAWAAASASLLAYAHVADPVMAGSALVNFAVPLWATWAQLLLIGGAAVSLVAACRGKSSRPL